MKIETTFNPTKQDRKQLKESFRLYNLSVIPDLPSEDEDQLVAVYLRRDDGTIGGGVEANIYWDGIEIELLWMSEELRGAGFGTRLMQEMERQAKEKGAGIAFLKTGEARKFYESLGYEVFGILEDRPIDTKLYYMKKRLRE